MSFKKMARVIAEIVVFLEFSEEHIINSDSAISLLERISFGLAEMSDSEREELNNIFIEISSDYPEGETRKFVRDLGHNLGFLEE